MYQRVKKKCLMSDLVRKYSKVNLSEAAYDFQVDKNEKLIVGSTHERWGCSMFQSEFCFWVDDGAFHVASQIVSVFVFVMGG